MQKLQLFSYENGWLRIGGTGSFSVAKTFDCGQCFRFDPVPDPTHTVEVEGVALDRYVRFAQDKPGEFFVFSTEEDFYHLWLHYLALDEDYEAINEKILAALPGNAFLEDAVRFSDGIHILRQDRWEALCSFIVSQNNNIPRIKKIITALCTAYGEALDGGHFTFPGPEAFHCAGEEAVFCLRTGFRAKYICDAARRLTEKSLSLEQVSAAPSYTEAERLLMTIRGVGPKVAACALLFGFGRTEAFPVDVWIKRVLMQRFPEGLHAAAFENTAGHAQQYLFYYERYQKH